ncbi:PTS fructose transporter subunit IIA [Enterococcus sp. DIV0242_7C1]|uniref:PTS system IIA component n=1 Tax=Candidatus Enterococcus dunnyi TaxID=1834192 RepID=A0A200J7T4_9ENTE|nr:MULTISPECIES: PTS fructose transporter subunit IIA [unclassified Enterococcus]MBO0471557.1 PTS fructose transporter subunit IIA [Enterococcus sp. DIV0242_7C1]OUZ32720.1 PTS system IIA component [Enterococcus sp. 9D6_DIV0238]
MKPKLILMSHGNMAKETFASTQMIVGDLANAEIVSMKAEDGLSGTQAKLQAILQKNGDVSTIIIADLKGGTPCNVAMMAMGTYPQLRVVSGLNLAMVIEASVSSLENVDELAAYLTTIGQQAVEMIELPELDEEEGFEE